MSTICPDCKQKVSETDVFCSHCGKQLSFDQPLSGLQKFKIYAVSFLLAPFGLYWFFKYYREGGEEKKMIAKRVLIITVVAIVTMILMGIVSARLYKNLLDQYSTLYSIY
jgi:membrane-associated HD superfamily phosphohydrolase